MVARPRNRSDREGLAEPGRLATALTLSITGALCAEAPRLTSDPRLVLTLQVRHGDPLEMLGDGLGTRRPPYHRASRNSSRLTGAVDRLGADRRGRQMRTISSHDEATVEKLADGRKRSGHDTQYSSANRSASETDTGVCAAAHWCGSCRKARQSSCAADVDPSHEHTPNRVSV